MDPNDGKKPENQNPSVCLPFRPIPPCSPPPRRTASAWESLCRTRTGTCVAGQSLLPLHNFPEEEEENRYIRLWMYELCFRYMRARERKRAVVQILLTSSEPSWQSFWLSQRHFFVMHCLSLTHWNCVSLQVFSVNNRDIKG